MYVHVCECFSVCVYTSIYVSLYVFIGMCVFAFTHNYVLILKIKTLGLGGKLVG